MVLIATFLRALLQMSTFANRGILTTTITMDPESTDPEVERIEWRDEEKDRIRVNEDPKKESKA